MTPVAVDVVLHPLPGGLLFVDVDVGDAGWDDAVAALRTLHPSVLSSASVLAFRSPIVRARESDEVLIEAGSGWPKAAPELAEAIRTTLFDQGLRPRAVAAVEFPVGRDPITGGDVPSAGLSELLAACRRVELEAFLLLNEGVWRPSRYHYRLPSGHHAATFVRVADALRTPRAAAALATWMHACLTASTGIVIDSGTLMPLVQQLDLISRLHDERVRHIEAVDAYPNSRFEFLRRFGSLENLDVLAILSVSSTGHTYQMLEKALQDTAAGKWRAECLVARSASTSQATALPAAKELGRQAPWLVLDNLDVPVGLDEKCRLCRRPSSAQLIHIDPRTFAAMALPRPTRIMPDTDDARRSASLFTAYQECPEGRPVQLAGTEWTRVRRNPHLRMTGRQRVRFEPTALLGSADAARSLCEARLDELDALPRRDPARADIGRALEALRSSGATVAICDPEETELIGADAHEILTAVGRSVCPDIQEVISERSLSALTERLSTHESVLLLAVGLQTSVTLQHLVVTVQDAFRTQGRSPVINGLVVHAHPTDERAWHSVRNSFRGDDGNSRLLALWLTYLPGVSPLAAEFDVLQTAQDAWFEGARPETRKLWEERLGFADHSDRTAETAAPPSPLWSPQKLTLRRTSRYGDLDDRHALVAVGAAMQQSLQNAQSAGAPEWVQFDLPNVLRSYFDGILHAAVLRWVTPDRVWWGETPNDAPALLAELSARNDDDWRLVLPEALLAAAEGKVPEPGVRFLLNDAHARLNSGKWPEEVLAYVDLGRLLAEQLL